VRPRLLLVAYSFPPDALVGALRWQKLAKHASDYGWDLDVITLSSSQFTRIDERGLEDLPDDIRRIEVAQRDGFIDRAHRWALWIRRLAAQKRTAEHRLASAQVSRPRNGFQAAARDSYLALLEYIRYRRWAHDAFHAAQPLIDSSVHRAIITTGPPHMAHEAGRLLSERSGIPLVADFRDPWSQVERLDDVGVVWYRLAKMYERRVMARAKMIVANTDLAAQRIRRAYPEHGERIVTVMNGYDDEAPVPEVARGPKFRVAFAGSIYADRSPRTTFQAAARVVRELGLTPSDFSIEFMGPVWRMEGLPLEDLARESGIADYVQVHPPRDRNAAHEFLASAAMLLNLPQENHSTAIPAKIFEYMRFPAWILALTDTDTAIGALLRNTGADLVAPDDIDAISHVLRERVLQFRAGVTPQPIAQDSRFSRRHQALVLFRAIEAITGPATVPDCGSRYLAQPAP